MNRAGDAVKQNKPGQKDREDAFCHVGNPDFERKTMEVNGARCKYCTSPLTFRIFN